MNREADRAGGGRPPSPDILLTHGYFLSTDRVEQRVMRPYAPLGILYLSAYLKRAGFLVDVLDTTFSAPTGFHSRIAEKRPRAVGLYATVITRQNVLRMVGDARSLGLPVIVGGPDPAQHAERYLEAGASALAVGEGEETLREWLAKVLDGGAGAAGLEEVSGLILPRNGGAWRTAPRARIGDLDSLPWPDRESIDLRPYLTSWRRRHGEASLSLLTARGCPYDCAWCSREVFGQSHRQRRPAEVVRELAHLQERYHPERVWIADDVLTLNRKWVLEFCRAVQAAGVAVPFECLSRVDCVDEEILSALRGIGCLRIWYGAESGEQRILDRMNKKFTVDQVRRATDLARRAGIEAGHFIMLGYPGESLADLKTTVRFLKEARPDLFGTSVAFPIKGTRFFEEVEDRVVEDQVWSQRNQNRLMFRGRYPGLFYWFAVRLVNNEVPLFNRYLPGWRRPANLYRAALAGAKALVCRAGVNLLGLLYRGRVRSVRPAGLA